jgi:hypothetical protein
MLTKNAQNIADDPINELLQTKNTATFLLDFICANEISYEERSTEDSAMLQLFASFVALQERKEEVEINNTGIGGRKKRKAEKTPNNKKKETDINPIYKNENNIYYSDSEEDCNFFQPEQSHYADSKKQGYNNPLELDKNEESPYNYSKEQSFNHFCDSSFGRF